MLTVYSQPVWIVRCVYMQHHRNNVAITFHCFTQDWSQNFLLQVFDLMIWFEFGFTNLAFFISELSLYLLRSKKRLKQARLMIILAISFWSSVDLGRNSAMMTSCHTFVLFCIGVLFLPLFSSVLEYLDVFLCRF